MNLLEKIQEKEDNTRFVIETPLQSGKSYTLYSKMYMYINQFLLRRQVVIFYPTQELVDYNYQLLKTIFSDYGITKLNRPSLPNNRNHIVIGTPDQYKSFYQEPSFPCMYIYEKAEELQDIFVISLHKHKGQHFYLCNQTPTYCKYFDFVHIKTEMNNNLASLTWNQLIHLYNSTNIYKVILYAEEKEIKTFYNKFTRDLFSVSLLCSKNKPSDNDYEIYKYKNGNNRILLTSTPVCIDYLDHDFCYKLSIC